MIKGCAIRQSHSLVQDYLFPGVRQVETSGDSTMVGKYINKCSIMINQFDCQRNFAFTNRMTSISVTTEILYGLYGDLICAHTLFPLVGSFPIWSISTNFASVGVCFPWPRQECRI
uniref:Uncharacterized protein n=1 Tax=Arion vulgaris TaxID=1028688 RepID=A0A0B7AR89_9EUPU